MDSLKTFGAVEITLGLMEVSLGSILLKENLWFKKDLFIVLTAAGLTFFTGLFLLCVGRKSSWGSVKFNMILQLSTLLFSIAAFGFLVRQVPYPQHKYCPDKHCSSYVWETQALVSGVLAILITIFLVEMIISIAVMLIILCFKISDPPQQPEDPECNASATSERLCPAGQNQETYGLDA